MLSSLLILSLRAFTAGDEVFRYGSTTFKYDDTIYIPAAAQNIEIIVSYNNVRDILLGSDFTYDTISGLVTITKVIPDNSVIACSYWYDKYYIEDINNYGRAYVELILNKVSKT